MYCERAGHFTYVLGGANAYRAANQNTPINWQIWVTNGGKSHPNSLQQKALLLFLAGLSRNLGVGISLQNCQSLSSGCVLPTTMAKASFIQWSSWQHQSVNTPLSIASMIVHFDSLDETRFATWYPQPTFRGTSRILSTCLITMDLCIWSVVHLNIPEPGGSWRQRGRKLGWLIARLLVRKWWLIASDRTKRRMR